MGATLSHETRPCPGGCGANLNVVDGEINDENHNCLNYLKRKLQESKVDQILQARELDALKNEVPNYRRRGPGTSSTIYKNITVSPSAGGATPDPDLIVPVSYNLVVTQKAACRKLVAAELKQNPPKPNLPLYRHNLEKRLELLLNEQYTQKAIHGPNTFWRVCVVPIEKASSHPPCPCHRGANEHNSKHLGGRCSGNEYRLLAKYTPETQDISPKIQVTLCHYVDLRSYKK